MQGISSQPTAATGIHFKAQNNRDLGKAIAAKVKSIFETEASARAA